MEFKIVKSIPGKLGRAGVIKTAHGDIKTPAFMAVGTNGYVRFIPATDLHELGAQAMLSNGYHLRRQAPTIAAASGLANWLPPHDEANSRPTRTNGKNFNATYDFGCSHQEQTEHPQATSEEDFNTASGLECSHREKYERPQITNGKDFNTAGGLECPHREKYGHPQITNGKDFNATYDLECSHQEQTGHLQATSKENSNVAGGLECSRRETKRAVEPTAQSEAPVKTGCRTGLADESALSHTNQTPWLSPTLTDSGGFQVMSLGSGLGKVVSMEKERHVTNTAHKERLAHVTDDGVNFLDPFTGQPDFIGPEESMQIQCQIGADIHMAFDELTSLADTYEYNIEAMERTERWAERSLREHIKHRDDLGYRQNLYGVLQGGRWEDLRRSTAKTLGTMSVNGVEFDGFGLGGAFLKEDLSEILRWCNEELPENKPRHLLGLSHPDDIFIGVEMGADTFDCVAPTREARHGKIYTRDGTFNLRQFAASGATLDRGCDCATCRAGWSRGGLRALWRSGDPLQKQKYCHLASIHNLRFIVRLTEEIRAAILDDYFDQYKTDFLRRYYSNP